MIIRHRTPDGRNLDIDMGGGEVGSTRGYRDRSIGAVQLPDAIAPTWINASRREAGRRGGLVKQARLRESS